MSDVPDVPDVPDVRIDVDDEQRAVLLPELAGLVDMSAALYSQIGRAWDPARPASLPADVAPVIRARDQLAGVGPWSLRGPAHDLRTLLTRLRTGAELALERGARRSPAHRATPTAMNAGDGEGTDLQLDVLGVAEALLARLAQVDAADPG